MPTTRSPRHSRVIGHRTRVGQERRARTRARIISAALRVIAERGPKAPVIDDFIKAAGVAHGTFYNYFTSIEQLLDAAAKTLEDELILSIEAEMGALEHPVERLSTGVRLWLRWAADDPTWCGFIVRSRFRGPLVERQLTSDLERGAAAGALSFASVEVARDLVVGSVLEAMRRITAGPVPTSYADDVAALILRGLGLNARTINRLLGRPIPAMRRPVRQLA
jgi:AcrR family transcriptional regulator